MVVRRLARMNPFTTDHPLAAQSSWFDAREHPVLSFVCSSVALAFILAPVVSVLFYCWAISDIGAEPDPLPDLGWLLFWCSAIAFVLSLFVAVPVVSLFRLFVRSRRRDVVA